MCHGWEICPFFGGRKQTQARIDRLCQSDLAQQPGIPKPTPQSKLAGFLSFFLTYIECWLDPVVLFRRQIVTRTRRFRSQLDHTFQSVNSMHILSSTSTARQSVPLQCQCCVWRRVGLLWVLLSKDALFIIHSSAAFPRFKAVQLSKAASSVQLK